MATQASSGAPPDLLSGDAGLAPPSTGQAQASEANYVSMEMAQGPGPVPEEDEDEENDDEAQSIVSSVLTADGVHDYSGFLCVCMVILLGDMSRGVMFPTMWPLVQSIGGTQVTLGFSVAAFSFGRVLVNPIFGSWSHTYGYTKVLLGSFSILLCGTLLYTQVQNVGRPEFLILAQIALGVGSGTLGVTRAFVADVTAKRNRTTYMALITAVQYAGFTTTPFFGALFSWLLQGKEMYDPHEFRLFRLTMYTAPAYFMAILLSMGLVILSIYFRDRQRINYVKDVKKKSTNQMAREDYGSTTTWIGLTVYDCCILGCLLLNVATKGSIASFETMGIAVAETHFELQSSKAGAIVATCGTIGVFSLLGMGRLSRRFSDIQLISGGMIIMSVGIATLVTIDDTINNPTWKFFLAIFLIYAVGYPVGHTAVIGMFSKRTYRGSEFSQIRLTDIFFLTVLFFRSRRTSSTRIPSRLVRLGGINSSNVLPDHVRIYF